MKVAFGRIIVTPKDVVGKAMAGYSRPHPCRGVLDDVFAYGVLMEDVILGNVKKRLLLISLDFLKVPLLISDYIREKIQEEFISLGPGQILIHATHTHSAPDLTGEFYWPGSALNVIKGIMFGANKNDRYIVWMTYEIVKMVKQLFKDLKPCKIAWTKSKIESEIIVVNRRHILKKIKPDLGVITFRGLDDNHLMGIIVNFACHPTSLSFANDKQSADYPGKVVHRIHELTKNKVKAVFFNGAAGDLNPVTTMLDYGDRDYLNKVGTPIYQQFGTYKHTKKIGYLIGEEALKLAESIPDSEYYDNMEFQSYLRTFWIPMDDFKYYSKQMVVNKIIHLVKKYLLFPVAMFPEEEPNFPGLAVKQKSIRKINIYTQVQYIEIKAYSGSKSKKFSIFTTPGELFEEIGEKLLKNSPTGPSDSFLFQCSNDWIAYLFPLNEYKQGGYERLPSFAPICGEFVEKELLTLFEELKAGVVFSHS